MQPPHRIMALTTAIATSSAAVSTRIITQNSHITSGKLFGIIDNPTRPQQQYRPNSHNRYITLARDRPKCCYQKQVNSILNLLHRLETQTQVTERHVTYTKCTLHTLTIKVKAYTNNFLQFSLLPSLRFRPLIVFGYCHCCDSCCWLLPLSQIVQKYVFADSEVSSKIQQLKRCSRSAIGELKGHATVATSTNIWKTDFVCFLLLFSESLRYIFYFLQQCWIPDIIETLIQLSSKSSHRDKGTRSIEQ